MKKSFKEIYLIYKGLTIFILRCKKFFFFLQKRLLQIAPIQQSEDDLTKLLEDSLTIY